MSGHDFEKNLGVLRMLSEALTVPRSLDEGLDHITRMTCELMDTEQAVFLFRDEESREFIVRSAVGIQGPNIRVGHKLVVPERLRSILWRLLNLHRINWVEAGIEEVRFPIIVMPISVKGSRIGLLAAGGARGGGERPFDPVRWQLFSLIAPFASLVIENSKVYDILRQHFAINSQMMREAAREDAGERDLAEQMTVNSLNNPTKVVRLLAESFYNELVRAGFSPAHVTTAAAKIIDCLTSES